MMKFKKLLNGFREVDWYNGKTINDILPWSKEPWVSQFEMVYSLD